MSRSKKISHVYNPDNQSKQELLDNFVVRLPVFDKLFRSIKDSKMDDAEQHFLIQGQRGTGKTTLLLKLAHEIENNPALAEWLIPVRLNEEQYNIFSLCRLWESVAAQLEDQPGFEDLLDIFEKSFEEKDYPANCFRILEKRLQRENKKLLLLIDNIVDVLKKIGEKECRQLRDILHTTTEIRIIAASARTLEHSFSHDKPFFEFFKIIYLEGLNQKETETLLLKLAESYQRPQMRVIIEQHPGRVETLRRLTGGIPRTIILLFEIFVDDSANVFEDLELILDRITPLYKHRMDDLSSQQQAIMDAIALNWDAIATKEIAKKVRMESKAVASQLKILENSSLIHSIAADRKNKLYMISERFFNIWYLMRYGRKKSREQVRFLVRFLEEWCSPEELTNRISKHIAMAQNESLHGKGAYYMCEALAQCSPSSDLQHKLIKSTREYLADTSPDLAEQLSASDQELIWEAYDLADKKKDLTAAVRKLQQIHRPDKDILNELGVFWAKYAETPDMAEGYFRKAIDQGHVNAIHNLAVLLEKEQKNFDEAEKYYRMAVDKGSIESTINLSNLIIKVRRNFNEAENILRLAVDKGSEYAMFNLAFNLMEVRKDIDGAEELYRLAADKGHTGAMNNLANLLRRERQNFDEAEKFYRLAVDNGEAESMFNLALLLGVVRKDFEGAEKFLRMAINGGHIAAMANLAWLLFALNKGKEEALHLAEQAFKQSPDVNNTLILAVCLLWDNAIGESFQTFRQVIVFDTFEKLSKTVTRYLIFLLAKKQHHLLLELFGDERYLLKERYKPIYYALMQRMRDEYPKEYKKMGEELRQTVEEILAEVDKMAKDYA